MRRTLNIVVDEMINPRAETRFIYVMLIIITLVTAIAIYYYATS
jgi:hypothetical protein